MGIRANKLNQAQDYLDKLNKMRLHRNKAKTLGLSDQEIQWFLEHDPRLQKAIDLAASSYAQLYSEFASWLEKGEAAFIAHVQEDFVNFYDDNAINPYVALNAYGPWIITWFGAVLHETGGYGMLGLGHNPENILKAISTPQIMANIMTPNVSQIRLTSRLKKELGHAWRKTNSNQSPFSKFLCLNSGSESVTISVRISDVNAKEVIEKKGRKGVARKFLALTGAFHGRTDRPAQASHSSLPKYKSHLASFAELDNLITVDPNDEAALRAAFARSEAEGFFIEAMLMEPVMGEGNPGMAVTPSFYNLARELTQKHEALLIVDSIQAGLRAQGCLSIVDYPGFGQCTPPDMETYSKAVNAGQFPLSILAMNERAAKLYRKGIYGNTMTANPRALEVACIVLDNIDDKFRKNIQERGQEFVTKLKKLQGKYPDIITKVQGTGLLISAEINPSIFDVVAAMGIETYLRINGINVIHGGKNAIRLTPCFDISSEEIDLIVSKIEDAFLHAPRKNP